MGREIRRVPVYWEHPKDELGNYKPMCDKDIETAGREWLDNCIAWDNGTHEDIIDDPELKMLYPFFWMLYGDPPDEKTNRQKFESEPTWFQVYETVSEGTPVTPPFSTEQKLIDYLVEYGDFWDQARGDGGWSRIKAEKFVNSKLAPSFMVTISENGIDMKAARDGA